jgi:hypothetical protein
MVTEHEEVPEHPPPLHPVNVEPDDAVAESVITVPDPTDSEQSVPQEIPEPVTVPAPVPFLETVRLYEVAWDKIGAEHEAVVPPMDPIQLHTFSVAVSVESERVPAEQALTELPHNPLIGDGGDTTLPPNE